MSANNHSDDLIKNFKGFYDRFTYGDMGDVESIYSPDIEFRDPVKKVSGISGMKDYFQGLTENLVSCRFVYIDELVSTDSAFITWEMIYQHKHLINGREITVRGMTHLKFTDRIYYHEDSYDMGSLVYEHLPILGRITKFLKARMEAS